MNAKPLRFRCHGFSLVESMVVAVVLALLVTMSLPNFLASIQNAKIRNAAESVLNGLQLARVEAVRRNTTVALSVSSNSAWTVGCTSVTNSCPTRIQSHSAGEGADGTTVTVTNADQAGTIYFNSFGASVRSNGSPMASTVVVNVDSTAISAAQSRDLRIVVPTGGSVRMCDPAVTSSSDPRYCG